MGRFQNNFSRKVSQHGAEAKGGRGVPLQALIIILGEKYRLVSSLVMLASSPDHTWINREMRIEKQL